MATVNSFLEAWTRELAQALQMMTGQDFRVTIPEQVTSAGPVDLWWAQDCTAAPKAVFAVGVELHVWNELGTRALQGSGLDLIDQAEAKSTWLEILQQAASGAARAISRPTLQLE